jgi:hypothetical protein
MQKNAYLSVLVVVTVAVRIDWKGLHWLQPAFLDSGLYRPERPALARFNDLGLYRPSFPTASLAAQIAKYNCL